MNMDEFLMGCAVGVLAGAVLVMVFTVLWHDMH